MNVFKESPAEKCRGTTRGTSGEGIISGSQRRGISGGVCKNFTEIPKRKASATARENIRESVPMLIKEVGEGRKTFPTHYFSSLLP